MKIANTENRSKEEFSVALINDTSLFNDHFGCQLVGQTFREQFSKHGLNLKICLPLSFELDEVAPALEECDLVVVNGEGSIHHGRNQHLVELASRFPAVLVNCVYQDNPDWPELAAFQYVAVRESLSADYLREKQINCEVVPDLLFASALLHAFPKPAGQEDLGLTDNVRKPASGFSPKTGNPAVYLYELCRYRRLCAGRFHAAIAAAVLEIPFSTWDSNTWKTQGLMRDMNLLQFHAPTQEAAIAICPDEFQPAAREYCQAARDKIDSMFDKFVTLAGENRAAERNSRG